MADVEVGDRVTIAGFNLPVRNPARTWWRPWCARYVTTNEPISATIIDIITSNVGNAPL